MCAIQRTPYSAVQKPQVQTSFAKPSNIPKVSIKKYVPPAPKQNNSFDERANKWMSAAAKEVFDPVILKSVTGSFAWSPIPMFDSQQPEQFGAPRYDADESQFGEWAYATPIVNRAGTNWQNQITFCPYGSPATGSEDFISSPYATLYTFISSMNRERKFAESSPWFELLKWRQTGGGKGVGGYLPNIRTFYLMTSIMYLNVKNEYNRDTKSSSDVQEVYGGPGNYGKGINPGEKLSIVAVSQQIWNDLTKTMNTRGRDGEWVYANPCDPTNLAVFYAWPHKKGRCPVPGVTSTTDISGMSGTVAGLLYAANGAVLSNISTAPASWISAQGMPTEAYYNAVPMHVADTINYMDDMTMIKELASAFADAKSIFDLAYKGTDFAQYLEVPEIQSIFGSVAQKYIYDSTVFDGAPTQHQVQQPSYHQHQMQQGPPQQEYPGVYPGTPAQKSWQAPQQPPQAPYQPPAAPAPQRPTTPAQFPQQQPNYDIPAAPAAQQLTMQDIYQGEGDIAVDIEGNPILDENGLPQNIHDLAAKIAANQAPWE